MAHEEVEKPTVIDLFCGCGGISRGFEQAGFRALCGLDLDQDSVDTFAINHPQAAAICAPIQNVDPDAIMRQLGLGRGDLDCLVGGPPCQSFSKNVPARHRFFDDPRNHLYAWFMAFVEAFAPKTVLIENVAEMASAHAGLIRDQILERLTSMGYQVHWQRLLAADYGVPQMRRRVFFLATRLSGSRVPFPLPDHHAPGKNPSLLAGEPYVTVADAIADLPSISHGEGVDPCGYATPSASRFMEAMRGQSTCVHDHVARSLAPLQLARLQAIRPGQRMKDLPPELQTKQGYGGAYSRLSWDKPALTITTWVFHPGSGRFGHPVDDRTITMREAARLQSFDDAFRFTGTYNSKSRQIGNAVPPLLAKAIAVEVRHHLEGTSPTSPQGDLVVGGLTG